MELNKQNNYSIGLYIEDNGKTENNKQEFKISVCNGLDNVENILFYSSSYNEVLEYLKILCDKYKCKVWVDCVRLGFIWTMHCNNLSHLLHSKGTINDQEYYGTTYGQNAADIYRQINQTKNYSEEFKHSIRLAITDYLQFNSLIPKESKFIRIDGNITKEDEENIIKLINIYLNK